MIKISDELKEKLKTCKSDVEIAKMLADNGVDVEEFQKSLPDEILSKIGGGYEDISGDIIYCPWCKNKESKEISSQILASLFNQEYIYRCRKCDCYFKQGQGFGDQAEMIKLYENPNDSIGF